VSSKNDLRPRFTAAILAGGQARRLGGIEKSALVIGSASILDRQLSLLRPLTPHILIVTSDPSRVARAGVGQDVGVAIDRVPRAGALGGIYTALMDAPTEQVIVIGCDMPFLTAPFLAYLAEQGTDVDAAMPADDRGRHPLCASYLRRTAGHFRARIDAGQLRVGEALAALTVRELGADELAPFDPDGRLLVNVNTPDDYARARASGS
jgi:molybdopterin-guanine dinucleotide biosynthesis protein A